MTNEHYNESWIQGVVIGNLELTVFLSITGLVGGCTRRTFYSGQRFALNC